MKVDFAVLTLSDCGDAGLPGRRSIVPVSRHGREYAALNPAVTRTRSIEAEVAFLRNKSQVPGQTYFNVTA